MKNHLLGIGLLVALPLSAAEKPLKVLLVAGGCCHDYAKQKDVLKEGLESRGDVKIEVVYSSDKTTKARFPLYENPNWADGFDAVIHDECSADVKESEYVANVLNAHKKVPAVNLHCAMHSYHTGNDDWFRFLGIQSTSHGPHFPIAIQFVDPEHPITRGLTNWTTVPEELYNNVKVFESAHALAKGKQTVKDRDFEYVVAWVNDYEGTRVFNMTLGHNNATVGDPRYLELVRRGLLWVCRKDGVGQ